jgi:hypothetical protein
MIRVAFRMLARRRSRSTPKPRLRSADASVTNRCRDPGVVLVEKRCEDSSTGSVPDKPASLRGDMRGALASPFASRSESWACEERSPRTRAPRKVEAFPRTPAVWCSSCEERGTRAWSDCFATWGRDVATAAREPIDRDSPVSTLARSLTPSVWEEPSLPAAMLSCGDASTTGAAVGARDVSASAGSRPVADAGTSAVRSFVADGGVATRAGRRLSGST